jgi:hypothetical protein
MPGQQQVFRDETGLAIYRNPDAFPRVWIVHEALKITDEDEAQRRLQDPAFDAHRTTFAFAGPPPLERCDGDEIRSFTRTVTSAAAVVQMKCRGMVIMSENDAPGWLARVDGRNAPIYRAYTTFRGVVVGAGLHRVETVYRPFSVIAGAIATLAGMLAALVIALRNRAVIAPARNTA